MTLGIGENVSSSFGFAKDGLVGQWLRWIILIVITCIPIVHLIASGYLVKIYKGGNVAPELEGYLGMFVDGIKLAIIGIVYTIIPIILMVVGTFLAGFGSLVGVVGANTGEMLDAIAGIAIATPGVMLMLVGFVLLIIFGLVAAIAGVRFAKTGKMMEGLNFGAVFATIKEIGWGHYILSCIVFVIVVCVIIVVLSMIPFIGWLLLLIITPLLIMFQGKFFENLYSRA